MTDHDRTLGQLEGKVDSMHETMSALCSKIDNMLEAHSACRQELVDRIGAAEGAVRAEKDRLDGYVKRAAVAGVLLIAGGGAGSEAVKRIIEALSQ